MALVETSNHGVTTNTTPVSVVAAPSASTRHVIRTITVHNAHSANVVFILTFKQAANLRILTQKTLAANTSYVWPYMLVLDATDESITIELTTSPATQSQFTAHYGVAS